MDPVQKAMRRREELQWELNEIEVYLKVSEKLALMPDAPPGVAPVAAPSVPAPKPPSQPGPLIQHTRDLVREILQQSGHALSKEELLEALRGRGMIVDGKDPGAVLYSRLHGEPELVNPRGIGWDLAARVAAASLPLGPPEADGLVNQS